jgi:acyl-CoA hydrolase
LFFCFFIDLNCFSLYLKNYLDGGFMFTLQRKKKGKPVSASAIKNRRVFLSWSQMGPHDIFFGGKVLQSIDHHALEVAMKHAEKKCELVSIDFIRFFSPARREDILVCHASVNHVWDTHLEVGIKVIAEDFRLLEQKEILSAYFLFQAVDETGLPAEIAQLIPESDEERRRWASAEKRRLLRNKSDAIP